MKKVQTGREDKRWEGRSEQVCRLQWLFPCDHGKGLTSVNRSYAPITSLNNADGKMNALALHQI